jgi:beta-glucosidase
MMDYDIRHGRTYMYFQGDPLYPFGFGLSYTTFTLSNLKPSSTSAASEATINVSADVTNTGSRPGDEVVQLYVHHLKSSVPRPTQELEGFQRISLAPGETRTVTIPLKIANLAYWNEKLNQFVVEKEPIELRLGDSSSNILLTSTVRIQ